jgi:hypothetical protein
MFAFFLAFMMLAAFAPLAFAEDGEEPDPAPTDYITVDSELFAGTLAEAIAAAGPGGIVGIHGRVETLPIGYGAVEDAAIIQDVTIQGETENATVILPALYFDLHDSGFDVLTIEGANVTIRNVTVDAFYKVDFAIKVSESASNVTLENVVAKRGIRGAVQILSSSAVTLSGTQANDSMQGGFFLDKIEDGTGLAFTNCSTSGNTRGGIIIRNSYGSVSDLDLSGVSCSENIFCVEDFMAGTLGGGPRGEILLAAAPKNAEGETIDTEKALFFRIDASYQHVRYGISEYDVLDARAYIPTDRYGLDTDIYYKSLSEAQGDLREGESITGLSVIQMLINRIMKLIAIIKSAIFS